jgi:hypothetical protein
MNANIDLTDKFSGILAINSNFNYSKEILEFKETIHSFIAYEFLLLP